MRREVFTQDAREMLPALENRERLEAVARRAHEGSAIEL
jgi:hypothetical protein